MQTEKDRKDGDVSLIRLLQQADLTNYAPKLRDQLKLRNAGDLQYVEEQDLSGIGMSRPEQKRLRKEYEKMYPSGVFGKLKRVFGRGETTEKKESNNSSVMESEEEQHVIPLERISLCKELGRGEFGSVWQASWRHTHSSTDILQVAVKCVDPGKFVATSSSFLQEAAIMTRMRHDNVVRLYGVVLDTKRVMMVSELATCGSLLECLHKPALRDSFPVHVLCDYAEQICNGMAYLESQRLIHRDLAARNVLVFSPKKVKISDFGLSRSLGVGEDYYRSEFNPNLRLPIAWCAPECINFLKFTSASDVWAFAVTLWEMFSYGEMPWNGRTGAEILEAVDRKQEMLPRPECCPEDIYDTMKECWTHNYHHRPTFADLVVQFPERLPQTVRAVCDVKDGVADHLSFKKDDLITVIHKTPSAYPDGYYWFGALRSGRVGLFRPADTVAHLGAENPSSADVIQNSSCVGGLLDKKEKKKDPKKTKEEEREKKKALISLPVGEAKHTCHVGIDGSVFGILQLDKKEMLPTAASPETRRSLGKASTSSLNSTTATSMATAVPLRPDSGRDGVSFRETMSLRDINVSGTMSPTLNRPMQPVKPSRSSLQPTAPPLTASAENSMNRDMQDVFDQLNSSLRSLEQTANSTSPLLNDDDSSFEIRRPQPVCAVYARSPINGHVSPPSTSDEILSAEVHHLERDLTDFSISTLNDFSDTRPLISSSRDTSSDVSSSIPKVSISSSSPSPNVRPMTSHEIEKWQNKQDREHRKAETLLSEGRRKEASGCGSFPTDENFSHCESYQLQRRLDTGPEWSAEAQEAYKLLVECGTTLKHTPSPSPAPSAVSTLDKKEKRVTIIENKQAPPRPATPPSDEGVTSYSPKKRVHIIETKLLPGPAEKCDSSPPTLPPKSNGEVRKPPGLPPKVRQVPIAMDGRSMNYDNLNGFGAGRQQPPPVPPKPKVNLRPPSTSPPPPGGKVEEKDSPGMAPAIARTANFDQPIHEYLGESGPPGLRLKTKSTGNLASDNLGKGLSAPSGQAFSNRYDFGASLSAAVQAAKDTMGKDRNSDGLYMKSHRKMSADPPTVQKPRSPVVVVREPTPVAPPPRPAAVAAVNPAPVAAPGTSSPNSSLASSSYEELVNKYCFFGSKQTSPQLQDGTLKNTRFDGASDGFGTRSTNSTSSSANGSPRMPQHAGSAQHHTMHYQPANPYFHDVHSMGASPVGSPLKTLVASAVDGPASQSQTSSINSASSTPLASGLAHLAGTSPHDPWVQHQGHFPFMGAEAHAPTAIRG